MRRTLATLLLVAIQIATVSADFEAAEGDDFIRHYCTQFGPIVLRIEGELVAGIFAIRQNGDLGSFSGSLEDATMTGTWIEPDSGGAIEIVMSDEGSRIDLRYNVDSEPERWYDGWVGVERPSERPARFQAGDLELICD